MEHPPPPTPVARVLLAEDNATNRRIITAFLARLGCAVDTAENGVLAVEAAAAARYDLIFMDVQMPAMDGLEATRRIRASGGPSAGAPVIALTASSREEDRQSCFDAGMNVYLTKPFTYDQLAEAIRHQGFSPPPPPAP